MSRFLKLERLDPYQLFKSTITGSRPVMKDAFERSFAAHRRCGELLRESQWRRSPSVNDAFGFRATVGEPPYLKASEAELDAMYLEAQVEDLQADYLASIVVLFADDTLQRFAKKLLNLNRGVGLYPGFGPTYGQGVHLTTLLHAATNAIRHVSEWDDAGLPFPYPGLSTLSKNSRWRQPMESIEIIQRAFGIGIHEQIRDVVSHRVLVAVDGHLTPEPNSTDYDRFEKAMVAAAIDVAREAAGDAPERLAAALKKSC